MRVTFSRKTNEVMGRMLVKPYQQVKIVECGEPLGSIPLDKFALLPHPYQQLGAPYQGRSPYYLRQSVLECLLQAQAQLQLQHPSWRIEIFDAYRPIAVQQFMVNYAFNQAVAERGLVADNLSQLQHQEIWQQVYQFWAVPSLDPRTPPPHSTGAAVDLSLVDGNGKAVSMGSPIDELSVRSHPDYFAQSTDPVEREYHAHRQLLCNVMYAAGFVRHPQEWWHFSLGDQMWAWLNREDFENVVARYGRVD